MKRAVTFLLSMILVVAGTFGVAGAQMATASPVASFVTASQDPGSPGGGVRAHKSTKAAATTAGFTGSGYYYVGTQQVFNEVPGGTDIVKGISATIEINTPYVQTSGTCSTSNICDHSLMEIALQGPNGDAVEFGWAAEPNYMGDTKPRLFASRWKWNGTTAVWGGCYTEGCGWIDKTPTDSTDDLGIDLTSVANATWPNNAKTFKVVYESPTTCGSSINTGNWQFYYGPSSALVNIGCYPPTQVPGFNSHVAQVYGEVFYAGKNVANGDKPCTDMGRSGRFGHEYNGAPIDTTDPAYFGSVSFYGGSLPAYANTFVTDTDSTLYDHQDIGSTGNRTWVGGGPGQGGVKNGC